MIVVTGGTKGIGKAIIEKFAANGHAIATCARNESELLTLKKEIETNFKVKVYTQKADLSSREETALFIDFVNAIGEAIEILVNNTGVFFPGEIHKEDDGFLEQQINTNLYSAYRITRGFINEMIARKSGHIFNMCSVASFMAYPNGGSYAISKHALYGFSKCLREEMKEFGVKVTSVLPGATFTASWEGAGIPEKRFIKSEDVAEAIFSVYSLSENSVVEEITIRPQLGDI